MSNAEQGPAGPLDASTGEALEITALVAGHLERLGVAYCIGGSDRQWEDLIGVLDVQGLRLDTEYLRRWAKELGLSDLLERASGETELDLDTE